MDDSERYDQSKAERYDRGNALAAAIILANPEKYAGLPVVWATLWSSRHPGQLLELPELEQAVGQTLDVDVRQRAEEIAGGGVRRAPTGRRNKRQPGLFDNLPIGSGLDDLVDDTPPSPVPVSPQLRLFEVPAVAIAERIQVQVVVQQEPPVISSGPYVATDDDIPF